MGNVKILKTASDKFSFRDSLGWLVFKIFWFQPKFFTSVIIKCQLTFRLQYCSLIQGTSVYNTGNTAFKYNKLVTHRNASCLLTET